MIDLDITSPLRTEQDIENAFAKAQEREDLQIIFSVCEARRNPWFNMFKIVGDHAEMVIESQFTGRQQAPEVYDVNASIYGPWLMHCLTVRWSWSWTRGPRRCWKTAARCSGAQQTMEIMAASLGVRDFHVYVLTNGIFASAHLPGRDAVSLVRHVPTVSVHLGRVEAVNELSVSWPPAGWASSRPKHG